MKLTDRRSCQECGGVQLVQCDYPDDFGRHFYAKYADQDIAQMGTDASVGFMQSGRFCRDCHAAMPDEELYAVVISNSGLSAAEQKKDLAEPKADRERRGAEIRRLIVG